MRTLSALLALPLAFAVVLAAAGRDASSAGENRFPEESAALVARMGPDQIIEMGLRKDGTFEAIEFHVPYAELPADARAAMEKLLPGGKVLDAEVEFTGGVKQYEVTMEVNGMEAEVLVDASGACVSWELQVEAAKVPEAVTKAAQGATGGDVTQWEEIRDGARALVAYHVKKTENGVKWKIAISPEGKVLGVWRETKAEVEVFVR